MNGINGADTIFMIFSTALVFIMTPGLALFYGGMVRKKNILSTTMHSYGAMAIISIQWILIGYTLCFGTDIKGLLGNFQFLGLSGVTFEPNADYAANIPHQVFMLFQLMFAIITPALISGALAERMKFIAYAIFILLWTTFVYDPVAHWVWGVGGWLRNLGALDFAGGNVVHISSGISGLVIALFLGKRKKLGAIVPHNLPITVLGAGLLWFGWFGFNAGSALAVNDIALNAFITTNTSAAAGAIGWSLCELLARKKVTSLGVASGAVAGLVSITPGAGFVTPISSILIGLIGGSICFFSVTVMKSKFGYDDALDAFGCHGVGGIWGGIATGIFASKAVNSAGADGLIYGNVHLLGVQLIAIIATVAFAAIVTFIILKVMSLFIKIRVSEEEEQVGLDVSEHAEEAYGSISM
ncbi:ammonium transporter NrgA [Clostridium homopropionicum DSM 5847]|uniref:Ammonium transporter n=1 Tax=Clostridium homopropionicum DSM 5847 TaxID=1121318 RepID=A0A0L6Z8S5_9CLOT|nr:ammonium transporter [Clostridium homopropionicum]KOA19370.1 ammonium transporter NrgA [Clostridium homopropionicum DSM 5847]SFG67734.1 ammonium transporter [Clostridium homopropionicum]